MINIKEYIESGILEDFLSGNTTEQEQREVQCLSKIYPEIKTELTQLELALEEYALTHSAKAPAGLKNKIMSQLVFADDIQEDEDTDNEEVETPIMPLNSLQPQAQTRSLWGWVAAAACMVMGFFMFQQNQSLKDSNATIAAQTTRLKSANDEAFILTHSATKFISLTDAAGKSPDGSVRIVWNPILKQVYINAYSLPTPAADKQYQLWCLVGGKPVDLGVFDVKTAMLKMKNTPQADAFAITLEKRGGSPTPNLQELYVMGKVG
jgi:Anti-sigma-K factor rskA